MIWWRPPIDPLPEAMRKSAEMIKALRGGKDDKSSPDLKPPPTVLPTKPKDFPNWRDTPPPKKEPPPKKDK